MILSQMQSPSKAKTGATIKRECDPVNDNAGNHPDGVWSSGVSMNGIPYKCTAEGKWVVDEEADAANREYIAKAEMDRKNLVWAARSRILTIEEMKELEKRGPWIMQRSCYGTCSVDLVQNEKLYNELLLQQFRLQIASKDHPCSKP